MWSYQYVDRKDILHYGVPGMKWGVRRARMQESRSAARLSKYVSKTEKRMSKDSKKLAALKSGGVGNSRKATKLQNRININTLGLAVGKNTLARATATLTPRELKRGKRQVRALGLIGLNG